MKLSYDVNAPSLGRTPSSSKPVHINLGERRAIKLRKRDGSIVTVIAGIHRVIAHELGHRLSGERDEPQTPECPAGPNTENNENPMIDQAWGLPPQIER